MNKILVFGAGRSSSALINYLAQQKSLPIQLTVADQDIDNARSKLPDGKGHAVQINILDAEQRSKLIQDHDLVLSLLPPHMHHLVVADAIHYKRHTITASYISDEVRVLDQAARKQGVMVMAELGLDPGLDHMSAMQEIDEINSMGTLIGFKSATGGIVAPESKDNPWGYKITWNPRNVVRAGSAGGTFLENGALVHLDYRDLFKHLEYWQFPGLGEFEVYANRNAIQYQELYGLDNIQTLYRGTIRYPGFCKAWNALVSLGLTADDKFPSGLNFRDWVFRSYPNAESIEELLDKSNIPFDQEVIEWIHSLKLISDEPLKPAYETSSEVLQDVLMDRWKMKPADRDMVLMQHQFDYGAENRVYRRTSSLKHIGQNSQDTAMSQLVGLPMGIFAVKILEGLRIQSGVHIPTNKTIYQPILRELERMDIRFEIQNEEL